MKASKKPPFDFDLLWSAIVSQEAHVRSSLFSLVSGLFIGVLILTLWYQEGVVRALGLALLVFLFLFLFLFLFVVGKCTLSAMGYQYCPLDLSLCDCGEVAVFGEVLPDQSVQVKKKL